MHMLLCQLLICPTHCPSVDYVLRSMYSDQVRCAIQLLNYYYSPVFHYIKDNILIERRM